MSLTGKEDLRTQLASPTAEAPYQVAVEVRGSHTSVLGAGLAHQPSTLSWTDISYSVPVKPTEVNEKGVKQILRNVSGCCRPGEMLAVMGPSGSGKTTLLDILADRVGSGSIGGRIELNGAPRRTRAFRAVASYVAQEDSLLGSFTVTETLRMAAQLSLPSRVTRAMIEERVTVVTTEMGLRSCADTLVGDLFRKGLSGGQRRRLSIAIELLSNPSILLLDEPTSGLDSSATYNVMKLLSGLCRDHQTTVVFTIHQPSSLVYDMFSSILLLSSGQTMYCGDREGALAHFAGAGFACPTYANPAEYFIELVNDDFEGHADVARLVRAYEESSAAKQVAQEIAAVRNGGGGGGYGGGGGMSYQTTRVGDVVHTDISDDGLTTTASTASEVPSALRQFWVILYRSSLNNVRNPGIYWVRLAMYIMLSFMVGTMYLSTNKDLTDDDMVPLLFYVQAFLVFMSVAVLPFFIEQRSVFLRERTNSQLHVGSFVVANFLAALPGIFLIALLSSLLVVLLAGLNSFGWFLLNLFLSLVVAESLMHVIGAAVPHYIIGIALGAGVFGMFMLCEGFMVPREAIPDYWIWGYYLAFHSYSFESFMYKHFAYEDSPRAKEILKRMGLEDVDVPRDMAILAGYAVILQLIFAFILYKFHTGRR